jgi:hypothetical protein
MRMERLMLAGTAILVSLAVQTAAATLAHAQDNAFRNLDTLNQLFERRAGSGQSDNEDLIERFEFGAITEIARLAILQECLKRERSTRQMQVGPLRYYQPHILRPGRSALPFVVESQVFESEDILLAAGRCFRAFRVTRIAEGSPILKRRLRVGDRIFAVDGYIFRGRDDFFEYLSNQVVGSEATIGILTAQSGRPDIIVAPYEDRERIIRLNPPRR